MKTHLFRTVAIVAVACGLAASVAAHDILDVALDRPVRMVGGDNRAYLKITLTGAELDADRRAPANVGIILDRSGSMQGEKLARAKEAATMAVNRLGRDDIVSIVAYADAVQVLLPATRVTDSQSIRAAIERIQAGGSTALFAGVSKGAAEVRKFLADHRVNRLILLSDGHANVGPDSPAELASLGASLKKEGISVSTIGLGLGYNEDLMSRLADRSDGNHSFVEHPRDLARIFDHEFGDLLSVAAQEVVVQIDCSPGAVPVRVLGREAEIVGPTVYVSLNHVYGGHQKYVLLELEVPPGGDGDTWPVATVAVGYRDMIGGEREESRRRVAIRYSRDPVAVEHAANADVMVSVVEQIAVERNQVAIALRDQGEVKKAESVLLGNVEYVDEFAQRFDSDRLRSLAEVNRQDAKQLDEEDWESTRKRMREKQQVIRQQQIEDPEAVPE